MYRFTWRVGGAFFGAFALISAILSHEVAAHGAAHHGRPDASRQALPPEQKPWGVAAQPSTTSRTIEIVMGDDMRFNPSHLEMRLGETVRLKVRNGGNLMHEMVIGTRAELDAHAALMIKHPNMEHDEPWMAHVESGKSADIVWLLETMKGESAVASWLLKSRSGVLDTGCCHDRVAPVPAIR